jgi:hypothetical protein
VRMGPLKIGRLAVGEARPLRSEERRALLEHVRRLRAGEVPVVPVAGGKETRRGEATRKSPASRKGGVARKSGAAGRATSGRRTRTSRDRDSDPADKPIRKTAKRPVGKPGSKPRSTSKPRKSSKPAARKSPGSRKPTPRGSQRTASSRKGVRK